MCRPFEILLCINDSVHILIKFLFVYFIIFFRRRKYKILFGKFIEKTIRSIQLLLKQIE